MENTIINPERLTDFNRTHGELVKLLFFSVAVAGKTAKSTAIGCAKFWGNTTDEDALSFLRGLTRLDMLRARIEMSRLGKYSTLIGFVNDLIEKNLNLRTCTLEQLESLHGVGPKTARMFLLHSRPNQKFAVLDVHVLKFLAEKHPSLTIPKSTPSGKKYRELEKVLFEFIRFLENNLIGVVRCSKGDLIIKWKEDEGKIDIAAFDLDLWRLYSGNTETVTVEG